MVTTVVEPATYAVFTHKGKLARLGETMNYIYGSWLPGSEYERANGNIPDLEWYDERFSPESDESELDLYIPLG
jgi:AraC family transcriptional regulator